MLIQQIKPNILYLIVLYMLQLEKVEKCLKTQHERD